jgi:hypothetical protein
MASMSGKQIKERLERDLGFEANRARLLTEAAASAEISMYWDRKGLGKLDDKTSSSLAKAALVSGLAGRQKLNDLLLKIATTNSKKIPLSELLIEISALVLDHQKTLNLSRNRASCVNAHLNVLDSERSLPQVYSPYLSAGELKKALAISNGLLKQNVNNSEDFSRWINDVHELLADVSTGNQNSDDEEDSLEGVGKKGLISRKAISTYLKQWELFATEKLGPNFSIEVREDEASPLSGRLNELEDGASRTWTTMLSDITEAKSSAVFQKRATAVTERATISASLKNIDNFDLKLNGRDLRIQMTPHVPEEVISQFSKAIKAQFMAYTGKGQFEVAIQSGGSVVTVSVADPTKPELKKIEEMLRELI